MNIVVVGKPKYNIIMPIDTFLKENSKNKVSEKIEITGGISSYVACMLAKWGLNVHYAGIVSGDEFGNKIKDEIASYGVDIKYLDTDYEHKTNLNYVFINKENGSSTEVEHDTAFYAQKFKFDFVPDYIITDGTDMGFAMAMVNNYPTSKIILLANKVDTEYYNLSKRCAYVCANINFAEALTKIKYDFNRPKSLVDFYQKIKDLNKAEYILMLRDKGVLYTKGRQVKMIPAFPIEKKLDDGNAGAAFFSAYAYGIINGYDMDEVAKVANVAGALSLTKIGSLNTIPLKEEVYKMVGFSEGKQPTKESVNVAPKETPKVEKTETPKEVPVNVEPVKENTAPITDNNKIENNPQSAPTPTVNKTDKESTEPVKVVSNPPASNAMPTGETPNNSSEIVKPTEVAKEGTINEEKVQ